LSLLYVDLCLAFRDQILISAVKRRVDNHGGELMRLLLQLMYVRTDPWVPSSNPLPYSEIKDLVRKASNPTLSQYLDQYLGVLGKITHLSWFKVIYGVS